MIDISSHIQRNELLQRLGYDINLLRELVDIFSSDSRELLNKIRNAIDTRDREALRKNAHTLKGSVSNFSAIRAYESALALETIGREGDFSRTDRAYVELFSDIEGLLQALESLCREEKP